MRPFSIPERCKPLIDPYPSPDLLMHATYGAGYSGVRSVLRLWFSEGIPFAFRPVPILYEVLREWIAARLQVHPKEITLIGSGRIGYSVCPPPKYGRPFGDESDLDLSIVSERLFRDVANAFSRWESDVERDNVKPRNEREGRFWKDNLLRVPENISRGFIDPYKVPVWDRYPIIEAVQDTLFLAGERLKVTPAAPKIKVVTARVYRDWEAFFRQVALNMSSTIQAYVAAAQNGEAKH